MRNRTPQPVIALASGFLAISLCAMAADPPAVKKLFAEEEWYKGTKAKERVFEGILCKEPSPMATSGRWNPVRLVVDQRTVREVYLGSKTDILDDYVGLRVHIVGKPQTVLGHREIWPARIDRSMGATDEKKLEKLLQDSPVVVAGKIEKIDLAPAPKDGESQLTYDTGYITVSKVVKNTLEKTEIKVGDKLPLAMPSVNGRIASSVDIRYAKGKEGIWILELKKGKYFAMHPAGLQPKEKERQIAAILASPTEKPKEPPLLTDQVAKDLAERYLAQKKLNWGVPIRTSAHGSSYRLVYSTPKAHLTGHRTLTVDRETGEVQEPPRW